MESLATAGRSVQSDQDKIDGHEVVLASREGTRSNHLEQAIRMRSLAGGFTIPVILFLLGLVPGAISMAMSAATSVDPETSFSRSQVLLLLACPALGLCVGIALSKHLGTRRFTKILADTQRLPFALHGLETVLGKPNSDLDLEIQFGETVPELETLHAALASVSDKVCITRNDGFHRGHQKDHRHHVGCIEVRGAPRAFSDEGRRELVERYFDGGVWLHRAAAEVLPALHASYPISAIHLR